MHTKHSLTHTHVAGSFGRVNFCIISILPRFLNILGTCVGVLMVAVGRHSLVFSHQTEGGDFQVGSAMVVLYSIWTLLRFRNIQLPDWLQKHYIPNTTEMADKRGRVLFGGEASPPVDIHSPHFTHANTANNILIHKYLYIYINIS